MGRGDPNPLRFTPPLFSLLLPRVKRVDRVELGRGIVQVKGDRNTVSGGTGRNKARRDYLPHLESLESLRLLAPLAPGAEVAPVPGGAVADPAAAFPESAASLEVAARFTQRDSIVPVAPEPATASVNPDRSLDSFDPLAAFLEATRAALEESETTRLTLEWAEAEVEAATHSGVDQMNRYLSRTWERAGVPSHQRDDCTQAVFVTLLERLGRPAFDRAMVWVGQHGVHDLFQRETPLGPDFLRALQTVKKRAQRVRSFISLDDDAHGPLASSLADPNGPSGSLLPLGPAALGPDDPTRGRLTIQEAMHNLLSPREARLLQATLEGMSPTEIAAELGVSPKTVSNDKCLVFRKLRDRLGDDSA